MSEISIIGIVRIEIATIMMIVLVVMETKMYYYCVTRLVPGPPTNQRARVVHGVTRSIFQLLVSLCILLLPLKARPLPRYLPRELKNEQQQIKNTYIERVKLNFNIYSTIPLQQLIKPENNSII